MICELCKKFKFDHTNKWNIHNAESVHENLTHWNISNQNSCWKINAKNDMK